MEQQNFFNNSCYPLSCKQRCGSVTLLMGRQHKWDSFCMCKGRCSIDTCKKARHIAAFYRAGLLRYAHSINLRQIKFLRQFLHHLRQRDRMMKQCIALPQAQLARFYRQKALLCANNLSSCIKHCQRGCIVACINAKRITARLFGLLRIQTVIPGHCAKQTVHEPGNLRPHHTFSSVPPPR